MTIPTDVSEAIVLCTRNRPVELHRTLDGIAAHPPTAPTLLAVVDASDASARRQNRMRIGDVEATPTVHWPYPATPSLPRQRNHALERLPPSVTIVHFIDDDVTVRAGYFDALSQVLHARPAVGGAGGVIVESNVDAVAASPSLLHRLFLLGHAEPGRVLPSGCTSSAQTPALPDEGLRATEWLSGCSSSYRRSLLDRHRFDPALTGYAMLEDLDLSYRIGREAHLVVEPAARLVHRRAPRNRWDAERYAHALTVHRGWFVEKHFDSVRARAAYGWSLLGRLLAVATSSSPQRNAAFRGLLRGIRTVLTRDHPLLRH